MIRTVSFSLGLLVVIGSFVLANKFQKPQKLSPPPPPPKVLMIGDSLSVGGFGEAVRKHLEHEFGRQNVAFFASCGSSPKVGCKINRYFIRDAVTARRRRRPTFIAIMRRAKGRQQWPRRRSRR